METPPLGLLRCASGSTQSPIDLLVGLIALAVQDLCAKAIRHSDTVPCPSCHFDWVHAGCEPKGDPRVPQRVWHLCEPSLWVPIIHPGWSAA